MHIFDNLKGNKKDNKIHLLPLKILKLLLLYGNICIRNHYLRNEICNLRNLSNILGESF